MTSTKRPRIKLLIAILTSSLGTAILLIGVFLISMDRVYAEYSTLLRLSRYRVVIPADPGIVGKLYSVDRDSTYLLVLTSRHSCRPEPYLVNLGKRTIGVPQLPQYVPLLRSAIVDRETFQGYPVDTEIAGDWEAKDNWREVHIRIHGFLYPREGDVAPARSDNTIPELIRLAYQKEIILLAD